MPSETERLQAEIERLRTFLIDARVDGFRAGFQAGAKAMREAAGKALRPCFGGCRYAQAVRALPLPETTDAE